VHYVQHWKPKEHASMSMSADLQCMRHWLLVLAVLAEQLQYLPDGSEIPDETNCQFEGDQRV
jgi:hypothetical protein